ncbi:MAG: DUF4293 domain-containing protein [Muribaculum sp.]|nr:DUF4293 domain-containing protein [Muribaculum sp.]
MVIQRWQTLFLLLAAICMALVSFLSLGTGTLPCGDTGCLSSLDFLPLFIVNILVTVLLVIDIFLFKNLGLQKKVAMVNILLEIVSIVIIGLLMIPSLSLSHILVLSWTAPLPVVALILTILARSRMSADERLLKSYDRLR